MIFWGGFIAAIDPIPPVIGCHLMVIIRLWS